MDYAKKLKLLFRAGDVDLPERRKRYSSSREEEDVATNMCPCGITLESSRTHIVEVDCQTYKETGCVRGRSDVCEMEEFGRLENSEKTIAILGDRWWSQTAKQDGYRFKQPVSMQYMEEA